MNKICIYRIMPMVCAIFVLSPHLVWSGSFFRTVEPGYEYHFPEDHFAHPEFQTEWWYYTGHLETDEGKNLGYELTFFRTGIESQRKRASQSSWVMRDIYFAHLAISDENKKAFRFWEKINRKGPGLAGAEKNRLLVWNEGWRLEGINGTHHLQAKEGDFGIDLILNPIKSPVIHGIEGISIKSLEPGHASHYYSLTRIDTKGQIWIEGRQTVVQGISWMDHEFFSHQLAEYQEGWDWYSIQLNNHTELMLYQLRLKGGKVDPASSGTLIGAKGETIHLTSSQFTVTPLEIWQSRKSGARYPSGWEIRIPSQDITLEVIPTFQDQELITKQTTYWEGSCKVRGLYKGQKVSGLGYTELTGYKEIVSIQPPPLDGPDSGK